MIPIILPDANITELEDRLDHAQYWKDKYGKLEPKLRELGVDNLGPTVLAEYSRTQEFARHVAEMLTLVIDRLIPRDFDRMAANDFTELLALMRPPS